MNTRQNARRAIRQGVGSWVVAVGLTASAAVAQFTNGVVTLNASADSDVIVTFPAQVAGKMTVTGTLTLERTNAGVGNVDLKVTAMELNGTIATTGLGNITVNIVADMTDTQRSNNLGHMTGAGFPAQGFFDIFFKVTATLPGMGTTICYSSLNQDNGRRAEPAHMAGTAVNTAGAGSYSLNLTAAAHDGNPAHTGLLFCTAQPDGSGITYMQVIGINLTLTGEDVPQNALIAAQSRRQHGAGAAYDVAAPLSGIVAREPRQAGSAPQMVLTFQNPPAADDNALDCSEIVITNGACAGVSVLGNDLVVDLSNLATNTCLILAVQGIQGLSGNNDVSVVLHEGDVNANGQVNILDLQAIKNQLNQPVSASNFRLDVTVNNSINILDLQATKNNLNQLAGCD